MSCTMVHLFPSLPCLLHRALEADLSAYTGLATSLKAEAPEMPAVFASALLQQVPLPAGLCVRCSECLWVDIPGTNTMLDSVVMLA